MGWISPIIITGKMFMQQLWLNKCGWDDPLPQQLSSSITAYFDTLRDIARFSIPQWIGLSQERCVVQMHGFSDAPLRKRMELQFISA